MRRTAINPGRLGLLRTIPLFSGCSKRELADVDAAVVDLNIKAGDVLMREGRPGREAYIIVSGDASVSVRGEQIARLGPGDFFGEMAVLLAAPRSATVTALSPMHVLVLTPRDLLGLLRVGNIGTLVLRDVMERLRTTLTGSTTKVGAGATSN